jgi:hypothetical protein
MQLNTPQQVSVSNEPETPRRPSLYAAQLANINLAEDGEEEDGNAS